MNKRFMRFPEGKKKSVTLSYDDCMEEDADLIELLEKYQMKATFNLIPGWFAKEGTTYPEGETYRLVTKKKAKEMYEHPLVEVANHGNEHKYMTSLTPLEMAEDTILCRKSLESLYVRLRVQKILTCQRIGLLGIRHVIMMMKLCLIWQTSLFRNKT